MKALIFDNKVVDVASTEFEVHESMTWMDCTDNCNLQWSVVDGALVVPPPSLPAPYGTVRSSEYPSIGDQLDMLFHAIEAGTLDTTSEFFTTLKAVKDANPKA